ncbi:MAG: hypothetical protein JW954_00680 [Dehalococcoidaceae bacterium]|nr:hypothetical protein [Dehalococcoidaceae bacterium]
MMAQGWKTAYRLLTDYLESNPLIKIQPTTTVIPTDVRPGFYAAFDQARKAFVKGYFNNELEAAGELSAEYRQLAEDIVSKLDILPEIELNPRLKWLMDDPLNGLMRLIYNPLFNLLKGKLDEEEFLQTSQAEFGSLFNDLYHKCYNLWVILALLELLEPSELMWVPQKEPNAINSLKELYKQGARVEPVPDLTRTSLLNFEPGTWDTFIVPDLIFYSAKLNKYVAIRRSLPVNTDEPYLIAKQRTPDREWISFKQLSEVFNLANHWPDILIYCDDKPQNLNLIADYNYMIRPEMIIDTFTQYSLFNAEEASRIRSHQHHLKPTRGTVLLYQHDIPDEAVKAFTPLKFHDVPPNGNGYSAATVDISTETPVQETSIIPEDATDIQPTGDVTSAIEPVITLMSSGGFDRQALNQIIEGLF